MYKRGKYYYFSKRINGKPIKVSLHSDNLDYCRIIRNKILESLNMGNHYENYAAKRAMQIIEKERQEHIDMLEDLKPYKENLNSKTSNKLNDLQNKVDNNLENQFQSLENSLLEKLSAKIETPAPIVEEKPNNDIYENLDKYYNDFIEHKKTFDKVSDASVSKYKGTLRYLKYFSNSETIYDFKFFKDLQKNLQLMPSNFAKYKKFYSKTFDELLELKDKDKQYTLMNKTTINNHMIYLSLFFLIFYMKKK